MVRAEIADARMALLNKMAGGEPGAVAVVQRHAALLIARDDAVDNHHAGDLLHQMNELFIGQYFGVHHQRRAAMANELFNGLTLFLLAVVAVANQQEITGLVGNLLHGFHHGTEERIGDIAHHQTDGVGRLLSKGAGIGIRVIVEGLHRRQYRLARGLAGFRGVIDNARDSGDRYSSQPGHILNCRHLTPSVLGKRLHT